MSSKPVRLRKQAHRDIQDAVAFYSSQGTDQAAMGFIRALERAFKHLGRQPATGSHRFAHELDLPGLRAWPVPRYPYLVFYVEGVDGIDVWRVLHGHRDLPAWLTSSEA